MEFWPIYVLACSALIVAASKRADCAKVVPALSAIISGVVAMRYTNLAAGEINLIGHGIDRQGLYSFLSWVVVTSFIVSQKRYLAGFLIGLSTLAYAPFFVLNIAITQLGIAAIVSDAFLVLAVLVCGNDVCGNLIGRCASRLAFGGYRRVGAQGVAQGQSGIIAAVRKG